MGFYWDFLVKWFLRDPLGQSTRKMSAKCSLKFYLHLIRQSYLGATLTGDNIEQGAKAAETVGWKLWFEQRADDRPLCDDLFSDLRGRLHVYDFPYKSAYDLLQIGCVYNSLYNKKKKHLHTILFLVRIAVEFPKRFDALQPKQGKIKRRFPEKEGKNYVSRKIK
jgi:hypothetical protein